MQPSTPTIPNTASTVTGWRSILPIHPAAELFPRMTPDEFKALAEDIKANGQRQPIAIIEKPRPRPDGTFHVHDPDQQIVLDGISRLDAIEGVGITVVGKDGQLDKRIQRIVIDTDEVDPVAFVISCNIHRRHLSAEQKRDLIAKLLKAQPDKPNNAIAKQVKADDKTVATVRREMEGRSEIPNVSTRTDSKGRSQPSSKPRKQKLPDPAAEAGQLFGRSISASPDGQRMFTDTLRDDIGPNVAGEIARKDAEIEELRNANRRLEIENTGLRSEVEELEAELAEAEADIWNCRLPIIQLLDRDMLQRIVDSDLLPASTKSKEWRAEHMGSEIVKRCTEIDEHNANVLLEILHEHFRDVLLLTETKLSDDATRADVIVKEEQTTDAAPPDDGLDIPASLRRSPVS